ncbi:MAG TPA: hypothetical protein VEZ40_14175 [Pyrinomonadaceae bacterium]|nr:hypothetical protein [Pyrinomonadaceae bacterium]
MFRRLKFSQTIPAGEWLMLLLGGVALGLLLAWLQKRFQLDPRVVRVALLAATGILLCRLVFIPVAYVKELRREEEEWAGAQAMTPTPNRKPLTL